MIYNYRMIFIFVVVAIVGDVLGVLSVSVLTPAHHESSVSIAPDVDDRILEAKLVRGEKVLFRGEKNIYVYSIEERKIVNMVGLNNLSSPGDFALTTDGDLLLYTSVNRSGGAGYYELWYYRFSSGEGGRVWHISEENISSYGEEIEGYGDKTWLEVGWENKRAFYFIPITVSFAGERFNTLMLFVVDIEKRDVDRYIYISGIVRLTGDILVEDVGGIGEIKDVDVEPAGVMVAVAYENVVSLQHLWGGNIWGSISAATLLREFPYKSEASSVAFNPKGGEVAALLEKSLGGKSRYEVYMFNSRDGTYVKAYTSPVYGEGRYDISFSEDGKKIYVLHLKSLRLDILSHSMDSVSLYRSVYLILTISIFVVSAVTLGYVTIQTFEKIGHPRNLLSIFLFLIFLQAGLFSVFHLSAVYMVRTFFWGFALLLLMRKDIRVGGHESIIQRLPLFLLAQMVFILIFQHFYL